MAISSPMPAPHSPYFAEFDAAVRKRTSSFSVMVSPPNKVPRKSALQRTASYLVLPELVPDARPHSSYHVRRSPKSEWSSAPRTTYPFDSNSIFTTPPSAPPVPPLPSSIASSPTSSSRVACSILRKPVPSYPPPPAPLPALPVASSSRLPPPSLRLSPPTMSMPMHMAPAPRCVPSVSNPVPKSFSKPRNPKSARRFLPPRERYPKCKEEPSLYRTALLARLSSSPVGDQILRMGPRLAIAMVEATQALEGIVAEQEHDMDLDADGEFDEEEEPVTPTEDKALASFFEPMVAGPSDSWLVIPHEDWEMVEQ